jgi:hypothetical protein
VRWQQHKENMRSIKRGPKKHLRARLPATKLEDAELSALLLLDLCAFGIEAEQVCRSQVPHRRDAIKKVVGTSKII